jgi:hypothetical protein
VPVVVVSALGSMTSAKRQSVRKMAAMRWQTKRKASASVMMVAGFMVKRSFDCFGVIGSGGVIGVSIDIPPLPPYCCGEWGGN